MQRLPFIYVMVVWGDKYVDMMLDVTIPCLLAPNNLPGLPNLAESRFLIVTTQEDWARIVQSNAFRSLSKLIEVEFLDSPWRGCDLPYWFQASRGQQAAARIAEKENAYCIFLAPDFVLSDGSLAALEQLARSGKQAVMVPGLRLASETISPHLKSLSTQGDLRLPARELVGLAMNHIHPENEMFNWDHPCFAGNPVVCTWSIPGEAGLLLRAFHLHPLMVKVTRADSVDLLETNSIDGEFLGFNFPDWRVVHVETDSDNVALFSLTSLEDRRYPTKQCTASEAILRRMAYAESVNPLHRFYFMHAVKLHAGELNETWRHAEQQTGRVAYRVLSVSGELHSGGIQKPAAEYLPQIYGRQLLRELLKRVNYRLGQAARAIPWVFGELLGLRFIRSDSLKRLQAEKEGLENQVGDLKSQVSGLHRQSDRSGIRSDTGQVRKSAASVAGER